MLVALGKGVFLGFGTFLSMTILRWMRRIADQGTADLQRWCTPRVRHDLLQKPAGKVLPVRKIVCLRKTRPRKKIRL